MGDGWFFKGDKMDQLTFIVTGQSMKQDLGI